MSSAHSYSANTWRSNREHGWRHLWRLWTALLWIALGAPTIANAPTEYEVKAAYLYKLSLFVQWPSNAFASSNAPFVIGIIGQDPFGQALDEMVKGDTVNGHVMVIKRFADDADASNCQILFISRAEQERVQPILRKVKKLPVLTTSDLDEFGEHGGMIRFYMDKGSVRFEINLSAANEAGLKIDSKLLRLAHIVQENGS